MSVAGIDEDGIYYGYEEDLDLKRKIRSQSKKIVLLIDKSKIGKSHNFHVFDIKDIDILIVNTKLPNSSNEIVKKSNIKVINIFNK